MADYLGRFDECVPQDGVAAGDDDDLEETAERVPVVLQPGVDGRYELSPSTSSVGTRARSNGTVCDAITPYAATTAAWL